MLRSMGFRDLACWRRRTSLLLILGLASFAGATAAEAATRTFKTVPADGFWSNPANWQDGVVPVDGDDLVFPAGLTLPVVVNTIANLQVRSLSLDGAVQINGQPFSLGEGGLTWKGNRPSTCL